MSTETKIPEQLQDAVARVERANQLIDELRGAIRKYEAMEYARYLPKFDEAVGNYTANLPDPTQFPPPPEIKVLVGEIVDNLRNALDYLIFQLAKHNKAKEVPNTQFITAKNLAEFERRKKKRLKGLKPHQINMIEEYQPYNGGEWLELLVNISNRDKHRELNDVYNYDNVVLNFGTINEDQDQREFLVFKNVDDHGANVSIKRDTIGIYLADGYPAVQTLEVMLEGVRLVLLRFFADFDAQ